MGGKPMSMQAAIRVRKQRRQDKKSIRMWNTRGIVRSGNTKPAAKKGKK
jgi:hypothetical protein